MQDAPEAPQKTRRPWTRNSVACLNCRKRKSRCSGQPCQFCTKYGFECIVEPLTHGQSGGSQFHRPAKRKAVEQDVIQSEQQSQGSPSVSHLAHELVHQNMQSPDIPAQQPLESESAANAMGQPLSLSFPSLPSKSSPFYGTSSALSFAKTIIAAALPNFTLPPPETTDVNADAGRMAIHTSSAEDAVELPMRSIADSMVENFFQRSHDIFRVLHRPTFMQDYNSIWQPGYELSTTFLSLLNIIFGLSCIFAKGVCTKESEKYYRRSVQLRRITSDAESVTLIEVQALLLQCHYLQSTSSATRCWQTLSQAISAAYTLGINCASSHITNHIVRESRLRAWLACRNLDAVSGSTFGRAPQIALSTASLVPMPAEVADDDCITATGIRSSPTSEPSRMSAFVWSGRIYAIMSKILQNLYVPVDVRGFQESETVENEIMLGIESELQEIQETLPLHLAHKGAIDLTQYADLRDWRLRQKVIIQNRYLRTRALLFRPSLMRALKAKAQAVSQSHVKPATLASATSAAARQLCFECACEQIDLCYSTTATQLDAPWFRRFYMCDCLSILLACKILSIGDDVFQQYWGKAVHVFHATFDSETSATASHGLHLLEAIRHQLEQAQISSFEFSSDLANLLSSSNVFLASQEFNWLDKYVDYNASVVPEWDNPLYQPAASRDLPSSNMPSGPGSSGSHLM